MPFLSARSSPPPAPEGWVESRGSGWGTPTGCQCSGYANKHGFGSYCKGWEVDGQTPWCYVHSNCTVETNGGSFAHRYLECTEKPAAGSWLGRRLQDPAAKGGKGSAKGGGAKAGNVAAAGGGPRLAAKTKTMGGHHPPSHSHPPSSKHSTGHVSHLKHVSMLSQKKKATLPFDQEQAGRPVTVRNGP